MDRDKPMRVIVRGAGDLATGVIQKLYHAGFLVYVTETERPTAVRRAASLSEAVYDGEVTVEDITAVKADSLEQARAILANKKVPILIDPEFRYLKDIDPVAIIDAVIAKKNIGMSKDMAPITIALGPGFTAGVDCDVVIETMRGHNLGRLIFEGNAIPNTGSPGDIGGRAIERVLRAPHDGTVHLIRSIGDTVETGDLVMTVDDSEVTAPFPGVVRGLIRDNFEVTKGFKIGDIDPRCEEVDNCCTISDKARALGGAVIDAMIRLFRQKNMC
ncbi:MAG TPA: EF2563 family selenium-dependent molybdenum hydroxylase system protein [Clostridiaceae bacterium]|nr:EF2563 family selenium-dependent molybdenum hydroxylase system protein [Clostridiaceae bacterium]